MRNLCVLFLLFIVYSIIGWICEVITQLIYQRRFVNRGFLIGPYCPIYGVGSIIMTFLISSDNDYISVFLKSMAVCSILEYITSYLMEKMFKTRWWDYTKNKFNINGRVCLETMILFGLGGVIVVKIASPFILSKINLLHTLLLYIISLILFIIFVTDIVCSYNIINSFKKIPRNIRKDSTEDITKMVRQTLKEKSYFYKRLVYSFPNFESTIKKYDKRIEKQKLKVEKEKKKLKLLKNKN